MTQQPSYFRFLEAAKQAETAEALRADGFSVVQELRIGETQFDLVAEKGTQKLAYEFKAGKSSKTSRDSLRRLQEVAAQQGWQFRIVVVNPPPRVHVEVDRLQEHLLEHLMDRVPDELDRLSTHTRICGLSDVEISDLRMTNGEVRVRGTGCIDVELQYGSGSDQACGEGAKLYDSYPLHFTATLESTGDLQSLEDLTVDTSSFYE